MLKNCRHCGSMHVEQLDSMTYFCKECLQKYTIYGRYSSRIAYLEKLLSKYVDGPSSANVDVADFIFVMQFVKQLMEDLGD